MKKTIFVSLLLLISHFAVSDDCKSGCTTTIQIVDCIGSPVQGATVKVRLCCGDRSEKSDETNTNGEVSFPYCVDDICERQIFLSIPGYVSREEKMKGCEETSKGNVRCQVKMCTESVIVKANDN
jgi:uncharacterized GH25 family protein